MAKIFSDPVHGHITLHPACITIIDTPEFQRLRYIKQTGLLEYVYPGATHNRFGHSLGVCFLAGKFLRQLHEIQPELGISSTDILCVEIAGLCHDLGHGPFSHSWEQFLQKSGQIKGVEVYWKHENVSLIILDQLIYNNGLIPQLMKFGIGDKELKFIKSLIINRESEPGEKSFLYQIVNNEDSGLDVDKWDYFLRDCHYLGLTCEFDYERLMRFSRILKVDGRNQICFRDKVIDNVFSVFRTRGNLHKLAYQHKMVKLLDIMLLDALLEADGKITGPSGIKVDFWDWSIALGDTSSDFLSSAVDRFCSLTDSFVMTCFREYSSLKSVSAFLSAIDKRSSKSCLIYQHISTKVSPMLVSEYKVLEKIAQFLPSANSIVIQACTLQHPETLYSIKDLYPLKISDIRIDVAYIHWGKKEHNPVDFVNFYTKNTPCIIKKLGNETSLISPKSFQEIQIHMFCTRSDAFAIQVCKICFDKFWDSLKDSTLL